MMILKDLKLSRWHTVDERLKIPQDISGLYLFYNQEYELMYIGKSENLKQRINLHLTGNTNTKSIYHNFKHIRYAEVADPVDREIYETYYINLWKPKLNQEKTLTYRTKFYDKKYNSMAEEREKHEKKLEELAYIAITKHINLI